MFFSDITDGLLSQVANELSAAPDAAVEVHINSAGGSVHEGLAIYNALKPRKPIVFIQGLAASIASLIAMAGDRIIAAENALIMLHDPWIGGVAGNALDLRKQADTLDKHRNAMLGAYARSGLSRDRIQSMLAAETWLEAAEAKALGFVDEITEPVRYAAHASKCLSKYRNTPEGIIMQSQNGNAATDGADAQEVAANARRAVLAEIRDRNDHMKALAQAHMENPGVRAIYAAAISNPEMTLQAFGSDILAELGRGRGPLNGGGRVTNHGEGGGEPNGSDFVQAASDAMVIRAGIRVNSPHAAAKDLNGMGIGELARACISRSGAGRGLGQTGAGLIRAAMSTSDFPAILENSLGKALRKGFEVEPMTADAWTSKILVPDFKPQTRVILGAAPDLLPVAEGAEYLYGSFDEDKSVPYQVGKWGRIVRLTWEALVNDDLGAFLRINQAMGQAAARAEADAIYATFALNSGNGPTMQDGKALFHADHKNMVPAAGQLDAAALGLARTLMRKQVGSSGSPLNLAPRFLLVAPDLEQDAEILLAQASRGVITGTENLLTPSWVGQLQLVVDARLSANAFYLTAAPAAIDTFERAWLDSDNGPVIQERSNIDDDTRDYKVRHVFGGRWLDWRGAVKVPLS